MLGFSGHRQATGYRLQATCYRLQATCYGLKQNPISSDSHRPAYRGAVMATPGARHRTREAQSYTVTKAGGHFKRTKGRNRREERERWRERERGEPDSVSDRDRSLAGPRVWGYSTTHT